ncbi:MAG: hypothetical protein M3R35_03170 [Candidatus Eremiobacteraeota bacterium]|nr:hypothetical protein [Candidatus Eremiobacteraeota bacterium]
MRMALIALILFLGLTLANVLAFKHSAELMQNPYHATPLTPIGAAVVATAAADQKTNARNAFVWREIAAAVVTVAAWGVISMLGSTNRRG